MEKRKKHKWLPEHDAFLKENIKGRPLEELRILFNNHFNATITMCALNGRKTKLKIRNGVNGGRFKKGSTPPNKGKKWDDYLSKESQKKCRETTFKKGNINYNTRKVGEERFDKDGYVCIKIAEPNVWDWKHIYIWEQAYGPYNRKTHCLRFLDGNKANITLENLTLIKRKHNLIINHSTPFTKYKELNETIVITSKLIDKISERRKQNGGKK